MVHSPVSLRCCWAWGSPRCSAGDASALVMVMASFTAKAVPCTSLSVLAMRNASASC